MKFIGYEEQIQLEYKVKEQDSIAQRKVGLLNRDSQRFFESFIGNREGEGVIEFNRVNVSSI